MTFISARPPSFFLNNIKFKIIIGRASFAKYPNLIEPRISESPQIRSKLSRGGFETKDWFSINKGNVVNKHLLDFDWPGRTKIFEAKTMGDYIFFEGERSIV